MQDSHQGLKAFPIPEKSLGESRRKCFATAILKYAKSPRNNEKKILKKGREENISLKSKLKKKKKTATNSETRQAARQRDGERKVLT